jgi:hypothetical protein
MDICKEISFQKSVTPPESLCISLLRGITD